MKRSGKFIVVLVTAPNLMVARRLAQGAVRKKWVACVNLIPKVESHYRWREKVESAGEVLMICKTTKRRLAGLEKFVVANHPYDTPEFVVVSIAGGNRRYLSWIAASVKA
jgi:periplasmic divalent cation tolerance protein